MSTMIERSRARRANAREDDRSQRARQSMDRPAMRGSIPSMVVDTDSDSSPARPPAGAGVVAAAAAAGLHSPPSHGRMDGAIMRRVPLPPPRPSRQPRHAAIAAGWGAGVAPPDRWTGAQSVQCTQGFPAPCSPRARARATERLLRRAFRRPYSLSTHVERCDAPPPAALPPRRSCGSAVGQASLSARRPASRSQAPSAEAGAGPWPSDGPPP